MIVRLARRGRSPFGDDTTDPLSYLNLFDDYGASSSPVIDTGPTTQIPVGTATAAVSNPDLTSPDYFASVWGTGSGVPGSVGLAQPGSLYVTPEGNVVNDQSQVLATVNPATNKVSLSPGVSAASVPKGTAIDVANIGSNLTKALSSLFGINKTVNSAAPGTASFGTPILAGIPNQYVIAGGVIIFALMLRPPSGGKGR